MVLANDKRKEITLDESPVRQSLMVLPYSPNPIRGRVLDVLTQLMRHSQVDILYLDEGAQADLPDGVRQVITIDSSSKLARMVRILFGLARGFPIGHEFYNSVNLPRVLASMELNQYDMIYVQRLPLHRLHLKHPRVVYDADDCWSHKSSTMAATLKGYQKVLYTLDSLLSPRHEVAACNSAAAVLTTAEREVGHLRALGVTKPIEVYFHNHWHATPPRALRKRERLVISFHGKLSYVPNAMALRILNDHIAPRLDAKRFDLRIIGKCPPTFPAKFPKLKFSGYVESMSGALRDSDLSVFPISISVGFSNKAMESLAEGVPFIATRDIVDGLPAMPGLLDRGVYVREIADFYDEIERFSQLSIRERQEIANRCYAYVRSVYDAPLQNAQWQRLLGIPADMRVTEREPIAPRQ